MKTGVRPAVPSRSHQHSRSYLRAQHRQHSPSSLHTANAATCGPIDTAWCRCLPETTHKAPRSSTPTESPTPLPESTNTHPATGPPRRARCATPFQAIRLAYAPPARALSAARHVPLIHAVISATSLPPPSARRISGIPPLVPEPYVQRRMGQEVTHKYLGIRAHQLAVQERQQAPPNPIRHAYTSAPSMVSIRKRRMQVRDPLFRRACVVHRPHANSAYGITTRLIPERPPSPGYARHAPRAPPSPRSRKRHDGHATTRLQSPQYSNLKPSQRSIALRSKLSRNPFNSASPPPPGK